MTKRTQKDYQVLALAKTFVNGTELLVGLKVGAELLTRIAPQNSLAPTLTLIGTASQYIAPGFGAAALVTGLRGGYRPRPVAAARKLSAKAAKIFHIPAHLSVEPK